MAKKTKKEIQAEERMNYTDKDIKGLKKIKYEDLTAAQKAAYNETK